MLKPLRVGIKTNCRILKEMEILDHLTWLLKNLYCRSRIQFSPVIQSCQTHCNPMDCSMPGFPVHHQLPDLSLALVHWVSDAVQPSHPLSSPLLLPSVFPSIIVCSNESVLCIRWPKYWSFNLNISPSNDCLRLISFRRDWLDLLAVQGTHKSLL